MKIRNTGYLPAAVIVLAFFALWEVAVAGYHIPVYILPSPTRALAVLLAEPGYFFSSLAVTLFEALLGLALGLVLGVGVAVLVSLQPQLERGVMILAILVKSTPLVAIAPLLTIWFGFGVLPKVIITALLTFFPVLINTLVGLQSPERDMQDLMNVHVATGWQKLMFLNVFEAMPYLFAALRVAAPLSLVGAVVAEWAGASGGLGRVMWLAYANLNLPPLFASIFILSVAGMLIYGMVVWLELRLICWK